MTGKGLGKTSGEQSSHKPQTGTCASNSQLPQNKPQGRGIEWGWAYMHVWLEAPIACRCQVAREKKWKEKKDSYPGAGLSSECHGYLRQVTEWQCFKAPGTVPLNQTRLIELARAPPMMASPFALTRPGSSHHCRGRRPWYPRCAGLPQRYLAMAGRYMRQPSAAHWPLKGLPAPIFPLASPPSSHRMHPNLHCNFLSSDPNPTDRAQCE